MRIATGMAMALGLGCAAQGFQEPDGVRERFLARMRAELDRLPEYVCTQTVERLSRPAATRPWTRADTLRFEVAMVGGRELYSLDGARRFEERPLAELAGRGTITTGQLGEFARHLFLGPAARFTFRGDSEENGRRAFEYRYDVPPEKSGYRLRSGSAEAVVGFQGEFWIDAATLDLLRLEVQAYDIPEPLGLAEADTSLRYARVAIGDEEALLPAAATFRVAGVDGIENLNHTRLTGCRRYQVESTLRLEGEPVLPGGASVVSPDIALPAGAVLELVLDASLDPRTANAGDPVRARLVRPVRDGQKIIVPEGAVVSGRLARLERQTMPFPIYEVGLEFNRIEMGDAAAPLSATMTEAGPAPGLLKQAKRLEPTFSRRRQARMDILVRETQRGQGILQWDARRAPIPRGLRMKWRVEPGPTAAGDP